MKADEFPVGDLVLLKDHSVRGLSKKYTGSFQIVKVMNGTQQIQSLHDNKCKSKCLDVLHCGFAIR